MKQILSGKASHSTKKNY